MGEGDILDQAAKIAASAEASSSVIERRPGEKAYKFFMGGANAGEVLIRKSPVIEDQGQQTRQVTLEYVADLDDIGDLGMLKHVIGEQDLTIIPNRQKRGLGNWSHDRTFTLTREGLFADTSSGAFKGAITGEVQPDVKSVKVTSDAQLAQELFDILVAMGEQSKGRELFARFMELYHRDPYKFAYALMDHNYGPLDFDEDQIIAKAKQDLARGDSREDVRDEVAWMYRYKGKVPASWNMWYGITKTLEEAGAVNTQLDPNLLEAAVLSPNNHVIRATYTNQQLTTDQLAVIFVRVGGVSWHEEEIAKAQLVRGSSQEIIDQAKALAKEKGKELLAPLTTQKIPTLD